MPQKKSSFHFEQAIDELDKLVTQLESGDLSLEESLATFEKGIKLTRECQQKLTEAEQKVALLVGDGDQLQLTDFDTPDQD